ncbi:MAG: hypothetical protein AM326_04195 [Candidatus Thorarchaeota archaeon SMTZ-45]|nr:MAG: hypothetical protein AM326_04195 [Candidatus Thorarchaeota archaeon SMTZ-45]
MGDSKLLTKFRRLCDDYKAEFAIEGVVESFDTIYPVPPERLNRGMIIDSESGKKYVDFWFHKQSPVEVGQRVIVVGKPLVLRTNADVSFIGRNYPSKIDCVAPIAVLSPERRWIQSSREKWPRSPRLFMSVYAGFMVILYVLIAIPLTNLVFIMMNPLLSFLLLVLYIFAMCGPFPLMNYLHRSRLYNTDEMTWTLLMEEIATRFGVKISELVKKTNFESIP